MATKGTKTETVKPTCKIHLKYSGSYVVELDANYGSDYSAAQKFIAKLRKLGVTVLPETSETFD